MSKIGTIKYNAKGQRVIRTQKGWAIYWDGDMLSTLKTYFHDTPSAEVADMLGVGKTVVEDKAKELGLKKDPAWIKRQSLESLKLARLHNRLYGNKGQIKKGEHRGAATQFKKGDGNKHHTKESYAKMGKTHRRPVEAYHMDGTFYMWFEAQFKAAEFVKGTKGNISKALNGKIKTYKGYIWKYA